jgi:hypothetical protein
MNYFILLARLFLVAYASFFLLFAFGEGVTGDGLQHIFPAIFVVLILIFLWNKFILSAVVMGTLFALSIWFFHTYRDLVAFLIISLPLLVASILFLLGTRKNAKLNV